MPARDLFGEESWEVFCEPQSSDAYALTPSAEGDVAGPTTLASSGRREAMSLHKIWAVLQDFKSFDVSDQPTQPPIPEYLCRYSRAGASVDLVLDTDEGFLSLYPTGEPESAQWISVRPRLQNLIQEFEGLLGTRQPRDLRPNL
jgi:hypothetical protein